MKAYLHLHRSSLRIVGGLMLLWMLLWTPAVSQSVTQEPTPSYSSQDLHSYVEQIKGRWIDEASSLRHPENPDFCLKVDPANISTDEIRIVVGRYCQPGISQFLHFRYENAALHYTGASMDGCFFDLNRIDFIAIRYEVEGSDTVLVYEARELEYENHEIIRLRRSHTEMLRVAVRKDVLNLLVSGQFMLLDPSGNDLAMAPSEELTAELAYYDRYAALWPDFDLLCAGSGLNLVTLGGLYPSGHATVFAVEREGERFLLFETIFEEIPEDPGGPGLLRKGELAFVLVPQSDSIRPPSEL